MAKPGSFDDFVEQSTKSYPTARRGYSLGDLWTALPVVGFLLLALSYVMWSSFSPKYAFSSEQERIDFFREVQESPSKRVVLMVTDWCPACRNVESLLREHSISYVRLNIEQSAPGRRLYDSLVEKTGRRSIPQAVVDRTWVGSDYGAIIQKLSDPQA